jgi:hypothetical protein
MFQWVASIDLKANDQADANILVKHDENWIEQVCRDHGCYENIGEGLHKICLQTYICALFKTILLITVEYSGPRSKLFKKTNLTFGIDIKFFPEPPQKIKSGVSDVCQNIVNDFIKGIPKN